MDVPSIHDAEFRTLIALANLAHDQNEAVGAVVWGESGSGKSNLLRRLGEWASTDRRACLVNFLELQTTPEKLPRAVLSALVSSFTNGFSKPWHATALYQLLEGLIRPALPANKRKLTPIELQNTFQAQADYLIREAGNTPAVRTALGLLFRFLRSALLEKSRRGDGQEAALAVRRLAGDSLDDEEAKALGLRPSDVADPLDPADCLHVLAVLTQLVRVSGQPVIICFDQINNLPRQQIADVGRLIHELNDRLRNVLLVLSEVRGELKKLTDAGIISEGAKDRTIYIAMQGGQALRHGDWKLIVRRKGKPELYNLADDPYESKDVAEARAAKVRQLEKLLREHRDRDDPTLPQDLAGLPK